MNPFFAAQTSSGVIDQDKDLWRVLLEQHNSELMILFMFTFLMITLIIIVPQLLRAHLKRSEMIHAEHMRALENGMAVEATDDSTRAAGRTAMLVPMVVVICAGTVTCFLIAYRSESVFSIALSVWAVAGVVSLAAITGGVALIGRLAQLKTGEDEEMPQNPLEE